MKRCWLWGGLVRTFYWLRRSKLDIVLWLTEEIKHPQKPILLLQIVFQKAKVGGQDGDKGEVQLETESEDKKSHKDNQFTRREEKHLIQ